MPLDLELHHGSLSSAVCSDENSYNNHHKTSSSLLPHKTAKRSKHIYSDRFIPLRVSTKLDTRFELNTEATMSPTVGDNQSEHFNTNNTTDSRTAANTNTTNSTTSSNTTTNQHPKDVFSSSSYSMLLQSELLGMESSTHALPSNYYEYMDTYYDPYSPPTARGMMRGASAFNFTTSSTMDTPLGHQQSNIFKFKTPQLSSIYDSSTISTVLPSSVMMRGATSMMRTRGYASGNGPGLHNTRRKIAKTPFKILDAPALQDDFYLNLVDWSSTNILAVGLGSSVYLWSACTSKVTKLCDLGTTDSVTSVSWSQRGSLLSIGTNTGETQLWDTSAGKKVRTMSGHMARVGTCAWNSQLLATGSRDRTILLRDIRASEQFEHQLTGHKQEVCGLKWSFDDSQLASGGNDNKLFVWSIPAASTSTTTIPVVRFADHTAAVKAIAWSPHQHGLLASGGGTADRCIRFWNTHTQTALNAIDTGSQVCNLMWSRNGNEVVSTHGYSLNQIIVWKYPTMTKLATLTGHTFRVLYLAMSPDGQTIVTGAGDETLRFWNVFPSSNAKGSSGGGRLGPGVLLPMRIGNEIR